MGLVEITPCPAVHADGGMCGIEDDGHDEHVYLAYRDGEPDHPVFWGGDAATDGGAS